MDQSKLSAACHLLPSLPKATVAGIDAKVAVYLADPANAQAQAAAAVKAATGAVRRAVKTMLSHVSRCDPLRFPKMRHILLRLIGNAITFHPIAMLGGCRHRGAAASALLSEAGNRT